MRYGGAMTRLLLAVLLLSACSTSPGYGTSLRQAAAYPAPSMVPAPRPPAYTPGYAPGTPPAPVYTPRGAGIPGERVPGAVPSVVPRSKGRMLPRTNEPGIWAADGAQASSASGIELFEVIVPMPADSAESMRFTAVQCAVEMESAKANAVQLHVSNYLKPARMCEAAKALLHCVGAGVEERERRARQRRESTWKDEASHRKLEKYLEELVKDWCKAPLTPDETATLKRITERWEWDTKNRTRP